MSPICTAVTQENEQDYLEQVADILRWYSSDPELAKEALAALDTTIITEPKSADPVNNKVRETVPTDYELTVSSFKRSNSNRIYLQWMLVVNKTEPRPGPLDIVSLEWDTTYGSYYLSSAGGTGCSVKGRNTGIVLFNLEDCNLVAGNYAYGTVQVEPVARGWMEFGSKFVHSYTQSNVTGSMSYNYAPSLQIAEAGGFSLGLAQTYGFVVNVDSVTYEFEKWTDNAVNIT